MTGVPEVARPWSNRACSAYSPFTEMFIRRAIPRLQLEIRGSLGGESSADAADLRSLMLQGPAADQLQKGSFMPAWAKLYIAVTALLGGVILCLTLPHWQAHNLLQFGLYVVLAAAASSLDITLPGLSGSMPLNYLFILIGVMLLDLPQALTVAMACTLAQCLCTKCRFQAWNLLFNLPNSATATACCYLVYHVAWLGRLHGGSPVVLLAASLTVLPGQHAHHCGNRPVDGRAGIPGRSGAPRFLWTAPAISVVRCPGRAHPTLYPSVRPWQWTLRAALPVSVS